MSWPHPAWRFGASLAIAVFLLGVTVAAGSARWLQQGIDVRAQNELEHIADRVAVQVSDRFGLPAYGLRGLAGLYAAEPQLSRRQFSAYVQSRDLPREFPGVRGFGFVRHVMRTERAAYVAAQRLTGSPAFAVRSIGVDSHADLYVVEQIEPENRKATAEGLDLGSEARRRESVERAVDTGRPVLSAGFALMPVSRGEIGVLMLLPLFEGGAWPATPQERRARLVGLLHTPISVASLMKGVSEVQAGRVDFELFDSNPNGGPGAPLYGAATIRPASASAWAPLPPAHRSSTRSIVAEDRALSLLVTSTDRFDADMASPLPWLVFAGGVLASALLALLLWQQATSRRRAEALARDMTADLDRMVQVVRQTTNAIAITDRDKRIIWINDAFQRFSGYTLDEAMGKTPAELLGSDKIDPAVRQITDDAGAAGTSCRVEILSRARDGREYWTDLEINPLYDPQGGIVGFMETGIDVTERRLASDRLEAALRDARVLLDTVNIHAIVSVADRAGNIIEVNDAFCRISGYSRAELIGRNHRVVNSGVQPREFWTAMWRGIARGRPWRGEVCNRAKDGSLYWVDTFIAPYLGADGRIEKYVSIRTDITASKDAEAALRASQALLDRTGRIGGVGGWEVDLATNTAKWTDETCRIHGQPAGHRPTLEEAIAYYDPRDRPVIEQAVAHTIATGEGWDLELRLVTLQGVHIWVRAIGEAEFLNGKPVRLFGAFQDVTKRRAMEAALRRNHDMTNAVLENLPCGLSVYDADMKFLAWNEAYLRLLDLPEALMAQPGVGLADVVRFNVARGEYGAEAVEANVQELVDAARHRSGYRVERLRPNGVPLEMRGGPMPGGGFVLTHTDISARRQAEAEVKRSAALLRGAIDALDEAFVLYDPQDRLVFCNEKYLNVYATSADLIEPGASFEHIVRSGAERGQYPEAVGRVDAWVAERMAMHRAGNRTVSQRLDDGRTLRIIERKTGDGHTVGFRIDITELVRSTEAAEQASLAKSQFLANVSHEIRSPMNAVLGMLALLNKTALTDRQADYARKAADAARSLLGLLDDTLDFSKIEAGKMVLDMHPFSLDDVLRNLSVIVSTNLGSKPLEVLFDIDPALPRRLLGDAMRLQQVLINLCGNAIKFTAAGEVVLSMRQTRRDAERVGLEIVVRDTGIGIAPENQARIFSGFTQAEASTTRRYGGTGLGVAISQRLVGLMGGELRLDSTLGHGSRFQFDLTLQALPPAPGDEPAPGAPLRALVVDDHPGARDVLARMGHALGWEVEAVDSGARAFERLQAQQAAGRAFEAVFVDALLPGLDVAETARHIAAFGAAGPLPVVLMVASQAHDLPAPGGAGAAGLPVLVKPLIASMLPAAVAQAGGGRERMLRAPAPAAAGAHGRRLDGMRLLVVEDNANNQQVARELLEDEGAQVQIAHHGGEAVQAVAVGSFDVVLMDLQMPVMDGYTAARRIRHDLGRWQLPIVAMTANALPADRDASLAAGMSDHVGKPFDIDHLVQVLRRHAGRAGPGDAAGTAATRLAVAAPPGSASAAAAAAGVELGAALNRLGGRQDVYLRMLRGVIRELPTLAPQLRSHAASGDAASALRLLHVLKGSAATLGATALAALAADAEQRLQGAPPAEELHRAAEALGLALDAVAPAWQTLQERLGATLPPAEPPAAGLQVANLQLALQSMVEPLRNADMAATDAMEALLRRHGSGAFGDRLQPLDEAIDALDFEHASHLCGELIETLGREAEPR